MLNRLVAIFVRLVQRYMPDPFIFALLLSIATFALAWIAGPKGPLELASAWYGGIWKILEFAIQMVLVLCAGYALAQSALIGKALEAVASAARTPPRAVAITVVVAMAASFLNWGFGLVVAALCAKTMARRVRGLDFGLVVAAAYSGFVVWASGLSSSIALISATRGAKLNFIEQTTGQLAPLPATLFTAYNLVPCAALLIALPLVFSRLRPRAVREVAREALESADAEGESEPSALLADEAAATPARSLERSPILTALLLALGILYIVFRARRQSLAPDVNFVIFLFLMLGLALHGRPARYLAAWNRAARSCGPLLLQYPLYGGILGLLDGSSLGERLSTFAVQISTTRTFPLFTFLSSNVISLFVPSGGGHWAVQGPIMLPAAAKLGVSPAVTAMAVAMGEQTANMVQPFWALPILAIAGLDVRDIMGYCVLTLLLSLVCFGAALTFLA
jgi:short-chain fatty acids transporter